MLIGQISLNISLCLYLIVFFPQLLLNIKRKNTQGFSIATHGFLSLGYLCDLVYGFGCQMQWQYKMVALVGLGCLIIQHCQFYQYGLNKKSEKNAYWIITFLSLAWGCFVTFAICCYHPGREFYDAIGLSATICWTLCVFPQIIQNYLRQSTAGLSLAFVVLSIIIKICDMISAWILNWDYPSKIGSVVFFCGGIILLLQVMHYAGKLKRSSVVAYC